MAEDKTVYDLELHETLTVEKVMGKGATGQDITKKIEITRVPGGWVYAFEYPGWRQTQMAFVPFDNPKLMKK
jgi:hypothetical protein